MPLFFASVKNRNVGTPFSNQASMKSNSLFLDTLESFGLGFDATFSCETLDRGCAKEAIDTWNIFNNVGSIFRFSDWTTVANNKSIRIDVFNNLNDT